MLDEAIRLDPDETRHEGITEEVINRLVRHLRNDTTDMSAADLRVPVANYVSEAHVAAERALFKTLPLIVACSGEVAEPGRFVTREVLGTSVLIVRQDDGTVATFLNRCRHRAAKVETEAQGSKRVFTCAYHGWSYERNGGKLRAVPYEPFFDPIDRACNGLAQVKTEERHGFIWADFSNHPNRTVSDYLGADADRALATFGLDRAKVYMNKTFVLDINWKLVLDGAIDTTHPPFLHTNGVDKLLHSNACVWVDYGRHGQLFTARKRLTDLVKAGEPIKANYRYFGTNMFVYPNNMVIATRDHVEFWTVWPSPETASKSIANIRFLIRPEAFNEDSKARMERSWAILNQAALEEDFPMEATIQANAKSDPSGACIYGRHELSCQKMHLQLRKDIGDAEV